MSRLQARLALLLLAVAAITPLCIFHYSQGPHNAFLLCQPGHPALIAVVGTIAICFAAVGAALFLFVAAFSGLSELWERAFQ